MSLSGLWKKITESPSFTPACIKIKAENTDCLERVKEPFIENEHYFEVVVNEMFLSYKRKWFHTFDPTVFTVAEFLYDGMKVSVPFVVGPSMISDKIKKLPDEGGMIYKDTTVTTLTPYIGGTLAVSVVLMQLPVENYLRKILRILENASRSLGNEFAAVIGGYIKVANIISDGIESVTESDDVKPLVGIREEFKQEGNLQPGYFVLINQPEQNYNAANFFVKDNQLYYGNSLQDAVHYRDGDYVLYSIMSAKKRTDITALPFYQTWKELNKYISEIEDKHFNEDQSKKIRGKLFALQNAIRFSPDITKKQAKTIIADYVKEAKQLEEDHNALSGGQKIVKVPKNEWEEDMDKIASEILS